MIAKFDGGATPAKGCVAKLEAKSVLGAKPENVCTTTGDTAALAGQADALVDDIVARLEGNAPAVCGDGVVSGNESRVR